MNPWKVFFSFVVTTGCAGVALLIADSTPTAAGDLILYSFLALIWGLLVAMINTQ